MSRHLLAAYYYRHILWAIGIVLLIGSVGYFAFFLGNEADDMITKVIVLRNSNEDVLVKSQLISELDVMVAATNNRDLELEWSDLHPCLKKGCTDAKYLSFIAAIAREEKASHSEIMSNLVTAYAIWGQDEAVVDFSKAVASVSEEVDEVGSRRVRDSWDSIITCNNECAERDQLFFDMVSELLRQ